MIPYQEVVTFHGHSCPGLALGYRMTQTAMEYLKLERARDEELVAVVENDACGTDAVQYLTGCTFGKGNLLFLDYGKMAYTFYHRSTRRAVRIARLAGAREKMDQLASTREDRIKLILTVPSDELFTLQQVEYIEPEFARLHENLLCDFCGETVMITRTRKIKDQVACIPCYNKYSRSADGE